jgi:hypothetical protein
MDFVLGGEQVSEGNYISTVRYSLRDKDGTVVTSVSDYYDRKALNEGNYKSFGPEKQRILLREIVKHTKPGDSILTTCEELPPIASHDDARRILNGEVVVIADLSDAVN